MDPSRGGSIGMIPSVAQSYVDRFGRFGNISEQSRITLETYFDARDALVGRADLRTGEPFGHPDTYVSGWDVGVWMPQHGQDLWYPVSSSNGSDSNINGLAPNPSFLGVAFTDLDPAYTEDTTQIDTKENWLSLLGFTQCEWNTTQD